MISFPPALLNGYRNFMGGRYQDQRDRYRVLAEQGQKPNTLVVACCDSRAAPEMIFDSIPGELFVVRNVANMVPPYEPDRATQHGTSAALEFGVQALAVKHIVVLGHAHCGGIRFFADDLPPLSSGDFITRWMSQIAPAAAALGPDARYDAELFRKRLEFASVELSLQNLMTFPWVKSKVDAGKLHLHGAYFGVAAGRMLVRDPATGRFEPIAEGTADAHN